MGSFFIYNIPYLMLNSVNGFFNLLLLYIKMSDQISQDIDGLIFHVQYA